MIQIKMSSNYQVPYETGAELLDCQNVTKGYNKASYSLDPTCDGVVPNCDNRSYSAYATDSAYQGLYDNCFVGQPETPQCDLKYVNAAPKVVESCWTKCCDPKMSNCNQDCHDMCVVSGASVFPLMHGKPITHPLIPVKPAGPVSSPAPFVPLK